MAVVDTFLKLTNGIDGESTDDKHKGEIEIDSWSWGVAQSGAGQRSGTTGSGAGKASFQDIHFVSKVNKASPKLFLACATGQHIDEVNLAVRKAGGAQQEYLKIKLTQVLVSSYHLGGSGHTEVAPTEQYSLNYAKVEFHYTPQDAKGNMMSEVIGGYDVSANKKV
ncbi:MAG: type VI secretion system tube protein Hcp [Acidobacteriia bacterium]|nr:type VI secretion system tube protein Hcp [Terriglobia bacterium]